MGDEVDHAIMAGDEWMYPTNDIGGFQKNQELLKTKWIIKMKLLCIHNLALTTKNHST